MWVHDAFDEHGKLQYFEIDNTFTPRGVAYRFVASIPGVQIIKKPKFWSFGDDDVFCIFKLGDKTLEIWEPYGHNSRFHIGANPPGWCRELEIVRDAFARRGVVKRRRL